MADRKTTYSLAKKDLRQEALEFEKHVVFVYKNELLVAHVLTAIGTNFIFSSCCGNKRSKSAMSSKRKCLDCSWKIFCKDRLKIRTD